MTHIFKPGDRAYWRGEGWIELVENLERDSSLYPLRERASVATFTAEGRKYAKGGNIVLFPLNPYDPMDPNNPQEFRNPFVHEGRIVKYGDQMLDKRTGKIVGSVSYLVVAHNGASMRIFNAGVTHEISIGNPNFTFADSISKKEKTYLWAVPMYERTAMESLVINFIRMTKEEAGKYWKAEMVPGSEEEE